MSWVAGIKEGGRQEDQQADQGGRLCANPGALEEVGEARTLSKQLPTMANVSHPLQNTVLGLRSAFRAGLIGPPCFKERYRGSFLRSAVRLYKPLCGRLL